MANAFILDHIIHADVKAAKAVFADLNQFSEHHPLFVKLEQTGPDSFLVKERMPFGPIKFSYKAQVINKPESDEIVYIAHPFFIILTITFSFSAGEILNTSKLKEHIHIKGAGIFIFVLKSLIKKMHPKLITSINSKLV
ncbi:MAG: SRPBCC family protein [Bacteroidetes bacterium]|nr:SRPBCC family protein [Bacteroidota bacterium]